MSIEQSRDANRLIEDIELELASIRAAMALRPLDEAGKLLPAAASAEPSPRPAVRSIGPFDLARSGTEAAAPAAASTPSASAVEPAPGGPPKRMTLSERLASMQDGD